MNQLCCLLFILHPSAFILQLRRVADFAIIDQVVGQYCPGEQVGDQGDEVVKEQHVDPADVEAVRHVLLQIVANHVGNDVHETAYPPGKEFVNQVDDRLGGRPVQRSRGGPLHGGG